MTPILSAHPAAALPVTGADVVLYVLVAAIIGVTGLLVRRASARDMPPRTRSSVAASM